MSSRSASVSSLPPGPRTPRALQAVYRMFRFAEFRARCYKRYGETFTLRVGTLPASVLTRDRSAIRRLFTGDPLGKRHGNDLLRPFVGDHSLLVLEPAEHLQRRRLVSPPFHGERVRSYAELMQQLVAGELDRVRRGDLLVAQPFAQALTLDVILRAVLGVSDRALHTRLREIFNQLAAPRNSIVILMPGLARRSRWNVFSWLVWRLKDELDALLFAHISATRADPALEQRDDILAMLVRARDENGAGLSDQELRDELVTLIVAGHETTATAIAWGVELLAHSPSVAQRARNGDDAYMDALVKEVLRMRAPSPVGAARYALEPFTLGPWTIPPDVGLLVDAHGIHHDPAVYPLPEAFRPERFLEESADGYAFLPFGGGAHRCLGAALAQLELKVVLRELLMRFEFAPVSPELAPPVARGPMIAPRGGGRVRIVRELRDGAFPQPHERTTHEAAAAVSPPDEQHARDPA